MMPPTIELLEAECARRNWDVEMVSALAWVLSRIETRKKVYAKGDVEYVLYYRNHRAHQRTEAARFNNRRMVK